MFNKNEELKKFFGAVDNFVNIIDEQQKIIDELEDKLNNVDNKNWNIYGFKVTKAILKYISQGIEEKQAIFLAYDDFKDVLTMRTIELIWKAGRASKAGLLLYGRAYCAKKMKLAGFKRFEIAQTLGVSQTTVNKLLNDCCIAD